MNRAGYLHGKGVPVYVDHEHAIAHDKVLIIDGQVVITGSFNFTNAAETRNAENLVVLNDPVIAARYRASWDRHRSHATPFGPTAPAGASESPVSPEVAAGRPGKRCVVDVPVARFGSNGSRFFLNTRADHRAADNFAVVVEPTAGLNEALLRGTVGGKVRVSGVVERYTYPDGKVVSQIKVNSPDQLLVLQE